MELQKKARLMNCLETILELETQLRTVRETGALVSEILSLRTLVRDLKLEQIQLAEAEIQRIEQATTFFLQELEIHFQLLGAKSLSAELVQ